MPEIKFHEEDGPLRLQFADHDAVIEGEGKIVYRLSHYAAKIVSSGRGRSRLVSAIDIVARIAAVVSAIGAVLFLIWQWKRGSSTPAAVSISAKVFSVALVGSLFSIGGLNLFSLRAQIGAAQKLAQSVRGCPFLPIFAGNPAEIRRPGNPRFCIKCPLGVDTIQNRDGLIHFCTAYPALHRAWRELPGAEKTLGI